MRDIKEDLFEQLYNRYYHMTYRYILSKVKDSWTTEDILSEVFIKIYKHKDKIVDVEKSGNWIIKIAHNSVIDFYRRNNLLDFSEEIDFEACYEIGYDNIFIMDEFIAVTKNLPCGIKELLTLRYCENLKFKEIAKLMNLPESTVKNKTYNGLRTARRMYNYELQQA